MSYKEHGDQHPPDEQEFLRDNADEDPEEEDFGEIVERPRGPLSVFPSLRHVLPAVLMFMLFYVATVIYGGYPQREYLWISGDSIFKNHEYWRLITAIFTHSDLSHLMSNALIFLVFGWMLNAYFGLLAFPITSLCIGAITNAITVAFYDPAIQLVGASGMAYGMVSLWLVFYIHNDTYYSLALRIFRAIGFALVMMFPTTFEPHVSYLSHAVGFGTGLLIGLLLERMIPVKDPS
jgi:rhomboid protease GluP